MLPHMIVVGLLYYGHSLGGKSSLLECHIWKPPAFQAHPLIDDIIAVEILVMRPIVLFSSDDSYEGDSPEIED